MDDLIFLGILFIAFVLVINICLHIWLGKKRNNKVLNDIRAILSGINSMEKSANSRDSSLRSLISKNEQKLGSAISQYVRNNEGRLGCLEDRVINEIQSSTGVLQNAIQQSHSALSKSFKSKFSDIGTELTELQHNLRDFKDDILRTQAQSFSGIETKIGVVKNEEHRFIEHQLQTVNNEQANVRKSIQEVTKSMNNHFTSIKPLEELLERLNTLYNKLISLDKDILSQEKSLNGMVEKHTKILEYTQDLQKTSEEIFDMMKLLVMDSVIKQTTPNK